MNFCASGRLCLDTLRIADPRYFSMTPGQYFSIALFLLGVFILIRGLPWGTVVKN